MGVLQAAELGALATIDAGPLGPKRQFVRPSGDQVLLARETRDPERMNDIEPFKLQPDFATDRDMDLVGGLEALLRRGAEILHAPPPLQPAHLDGEIIGPGHAQRARGEKTQY